MFDNWIMIKRGKLYFYDWLMFCLSNDNWFIQNKEIENQKNGLNIDHLIQFNLFFVFCFLLFALISIIRLLFDLIRSSGSIFLFVVLIIEFSLSLSHLHSPTFFHQAQIMIIESLIFFFCFVRPIIKHDEKSYWSWPHLFSFVSFVSFKSMTFK